MNARRWSDMILPAHIQAAKPQSELFEARMKQANCLDLLGRDPQAKYLEAAAHHPERAEPLYECVFLTDACESEAV